MARVVAGLCAVFIRPGRLIRSAIIFKPSTLLSLHRALIQTMNLRIAASTDADKISPMARFRQQHVAQVSLPTRDLANATQCATFSATM
jgi:hypothetical protein